MRTVISSPTYTLARKTANEKILFGKISTQKIPPCKIPTRKLPTRLIPTQSNSDKKIIFRRYKFSLVTLNNLCMVKDSKLRYAESVNFLTAVIEI